MTHSFKNTRIIIALAAVLAMSACNNSNEAAPKTQASAPAANAAASTAAVASTPVASNTSTENAAAKGIATQWMGVMVQVFQMADAANEKKKFTPEMVQCFVTHDNDKLVAKTQEYLNTKLSADEMRQLNEFYASNLGQKQVFMGEMMLASAFGKLPPAEEMKAKSPSEADLKEIEAFGTSPLAQKVNAALQDKNALTPYFKDLIDGKAKTCKLPS